MVSVWVAVLIGILGLVAGTWLGALIMCLCNVAREEPNPESTDCLNSKESFYER